MGARRHAVCYKCSSKLQFLRDERYSCERVSGEQTQEVYVSASQHMFEKVVSFVLVYF